MFRWRYGVLVAAAAAAFFAGKASMRAGGTGQRPGSAFPDAGQLKAGIAVGNDPAAQVKWLETASLAECEAFLAGRKLDERPVVLREAVMLRLSELDPAVLARYFFALPGGGRGIGTYQRWMSWLALGRPELLRERIAEPAVPLAQRESLQDALPRQAYEKPGEPVAVLEECLKTGKGRAAGTALAELAAKNPELAVRYLAKLIESGVPFSLNIDVLVPQLVMADPEGMQALLATARTPELQNSIASTLAKMLARDDPALAVALYGSLSPSRARSLVAVELVAVWAQRDPAAALEWAQATLPEGEARNTALCLALLPLAESDPRKVIALLAAANTSLESAGSGMLTRNFGKSGVTVNAVLEKAVLALIGTAPLEALQMVYDAKLPPLASPANRDGLLAKAAGSWLTRDPAGALAWLGTLPAEERTSLSFSQGKFAEELRSMSPEAAARTMQLVAAMEDKTYAARMGVYLATAMAQSDPAAALKLTDQLPEEFRDQWLALAIRGQTQLDPAAAAAEIPRLPEEWRTSAYEDVAAGLGRSSGLAAMDYLDSLPQENRRPGGYQGVLRQWTEDSWDEAFAWWRDLPAENTVARSGALAAMAGKLYAADPSSGPELLGQIAALPDADQRVDSLVLLLEEMAKSDLAGALAQTDNPAMNIPSYRLATIKGQVRRANEEATR